MDQIGIFRGLETELQVGDKVSVIVPWPGGPERRNAVVTEIREDRVFMEIDCYSGWWVKVVAPHETLHWHEFGAFWHVIWGSPEQQEWMDEQIARRREVIAENRHRLKRGRQPLKTKVPVYL